MIKKSILILVLVLIVILTGCKKIDEYGCEVSKGYSWCEFKDVCLKLSEEDCPIDEDLIEGECVFDEDCVTGGCSGTVCQSRDSEPVFTTCEFLPEYACYGQTICGCVNGQCNWDENEAFDNCVEEARKQI